MFSFLKNKYFWFAVAVIFIAAVWAGITFWEKISRKFENERAVWVKISPLSNDDDILKALEDSLGISYGQAVFDVWTTLKGRSGKAPGAYLINPGDKSIDIARRIRANDQTPIKVTFNNVRLLEQLAPKVSHNLQFDDDDFLKACNSVLPELGYSKADFIGAFLPDSYEFYWNTEPEDVVKRLEGYRNKFWNETRRNKAAVLGLTPEEVTTLASIVDEETAVKDEKPTIARLYLNRLKKGMKLQADPTVKYATGDFTLRRILQKHLDTPSPYNTYLNIGLPPGPIRMPEKSTIDAVLDAPENDYLYMCAKEDFSGRHNFAVTLAEHNANARRYRAALDASGIK